MSKHSYIVVLYLISCFTVDRVTSTCPNVKAVQNFQTDKFLGKWYMYARYPYLYQTNTKCNTAEYSLRDDGKLNVLHRDFNTLTGVTESIVGLAYNVSAIEAKFILHFPTRIVQIDSPYLVVGIDYENYTVIWACEEQGDLAGIYAWIMTREPKPSKSVFDNIEKVISESGIDRSTFEETSQDGCTIDF